MVSDMQMADFIEEIGNGFFMAPQRGRIWALGRAFITVTTHTASFHFFQHYQPDAVS
jgi:hypothetical protein